MKSLFLKIFVSYWLAQALFIVVAIVIMVATRPEREAKAGGVVPENTIQGAVTAYEDGGEDEVYRYLEDLHRSKGVRAFLFDAQGREISSQDPPPWIQRLATKSSLDLGDYWRTLFLRGFDRQVLAGKNGRHYIWVMEWHSGGRTILGPDSIPGAGILIAILSSGMVCLVMARYLTAPIVRLRAATQSLAAGNLAARAGSTKSRGSGDEISGLVRDFDTMAQRIENLVNAQSSLLKDISHELRSPLARLNVGLALARQRSGAEAQSALARIELEADRLNDLIGNLLTIARLDGSDSSQQKSVVDIAEMLADISKDADFEAQSKGCRVEMIVENECSVRGYPTLLHSALENVVRNALRYTEDGTAVQVRLECQHSSVGDEAFIRIVDSGPGVPGEDLSKIFQPFYRIDSARGRRTGGVGLGLAITERAVRLHGGTVRAENRPQGGLVVEIRMPALPRGFEKTAHPVLDAIPAPQK